MSSLLPENNIIPDVVENSTVGSGELPPVLVQSEMVSEDIANTNNINNLETSQVEGI